MRKEVRLGLVGCGGQGRNLSTALRRVEGGVLAAAADLKDEAAKQLAKEFGVKTYFLDYHELLAREDVDGVIIAVPHFALKNVAVDSAKAGKHVFIEKPMATNSVEAREIVKAAERVGVKVMVGYCQRYLAGRSSMKSFIDRGAIGEIDLVLGSKGSGLLGGWLLEEPKGGGITRYLGSHLIDQVLWMVGSEAESVSAEVNDHPTFGVDETSSFTIRFRNGVLASLSLTMRASKAIDSVEVVGSEGYMKSDWRENCLFIQSLRMVDYANPTTIQFTEDPVYPMFERELREFVKAVLEDRTPAITGLDGVRVLEVIDAVFKSSRMGKTVQLPSTINPL